jgi:hypothetical protein
MLQGRVQTLQNIPIDKKLNASLTVDKQRCRLGFLAWHSEFHVMVILDLKEMKVGRIAEKL